MAKKVLIISSSPRKGGNSDLLCDEFMKGALEAGNEVEKIVLKDKTVHPCTGCSVCSMYGKPCPQKDDAVEIVEKQASQCCLNIQQSEISRNSANVAVRILGTDFPEEIVTVTAHYDSVPEGPGAYDNMSGGAMVMEAFHHFAEHRPARTMEFIWFGSEEKGLVGSQNYVKSHEGEMSSHVFNLNVDLAGQLLGGNVLGVTADPTVCAELKNLMEENQLGVTIKNQVWASDSNTFAWKGVPALTLNRDGFGMHTRHDTVEYISPRALEEGAKTLCTAAAWVANEPELSFEREIPEDMKRELEKYFA